ncbi:MAG: bifunctional adenosylcobinamide kinase/adenosylcobinamide-phosphate guanylyltransferase [Oscillospiraceae bacterium]|nr:bifunctional adenosylcobinamide kinase/adenosylcobinamide-phosphate guanylyltransferase [Oscillospiraceae bacterium]
MILIVGGEGAGKKEFVKTLGYDDSQIADAVLDDRPVLYHLEKMMFADSDCMDDRLDDLLKKDVIICCEVGSGVIPAQRSDRTAREKTGRLTVRLAREADAVVRVVCGLSTVIKGELPCR